MGPYQIIGVGPEYAKIVPDGILNTISINWLTRETKERRPNMEVKSDSKTKTEADPAQKASPLRRRRTPTLRRKLSNTKTDQPGHNILFDCMATNYRKTRWNPPSTFTTDSRRHNSEDDKKFDKSLSLHGEREDRMEKVCT